MRVSFTGWTATDILLFVEKQVRDRLNTSSVPYISLSCIDEALEKDPGGSQIFHMIDDIVECWREIPGDPKYGTGDDLCDMRIPEPTGHHTLAEQATVSVSYRAPYRRITRHRQFRSSVSARTA